MTSMMDFISNKKSQKEVSKEEAMQARLLFSMQVQEVKALLEMISPEDIHDPLVASARVKLMCTLQGYIERQETAMLTVEEDLADQLEQMVMRVQETQNNE